MPLVPSSSETSARSAISVEAVTKIREFLVLLRGEEILSDAIIYAAAGSDEAQSARYHGRCGISKGHNYHRVHQGVSSASAGALILHPDPDYFFTLMKTAGGAYLWRALINLAHRTSASAGEKKRV
ncbi:hypothetical protein E2C01_063457 [Portunus trituberculatus]|uniref:Uncharacterized protein n=1 Tax=Portunus trituberculatus TaxID=210409 RepID=A0A5B7HHN1_PORTR|nr:hypothetical protein [Portunus trituberculatus]